MIDKVKGLRIYGFGGHARSIADVATASGIQQLVFADVDARDDEDFLGFPVIKSFDDILPDGWQCFPAAGDNRKRQVQTEHIRREDGHISHRYGGHRCDNRCGDFRWPSLPRGTDGEHRAILHSEYRLHCRT